MLSRPRRGRSLRSLPAACSSLVRWGRLRRRNRSRSVRRRHTQRSGRRVHSRGAVVASRVTPSNSTASSSTPAAFTVSVNVSGLSAGTYGGRVNLFGSGAASVGSVNVTLVLTAAPPPNVLARRNASGHPEAAAFVCAPSALTLTETGIPNNFSVPAGWPAALVARMTDDCGNPIDGGSVTATFSSGDAPLALDDQGSGGQYIRTWQPSNLANTVITLNGNAGPLRPAVVRFGRTRHAESGSGVEPQRHPQQFESGDRRRAGARHGCRGLWLRAHHFTDSGFARRLAAAPAVSKYAAHCRRLGRAAVLLERRPTQRGASGGACSAGAVSGSRGGEWRADTANYGVCRTARSGARGERGWQRDRARTAITT